MGKIPVYSHQAKEFIDKHIWWIVIVLFMCAVSIFLFK